MSITITDIITEHGAYYKAGGQSVKDLINAIYQGSVTEENLTPIRTDKTIVEKASAEITRVIQSFQKGWTPTGDTTFKPRSIPLYKLKIDVEEYPDDIEQSWLGFLAANQLDRKSWPFVKYWLQELVLKKAMEDLETAEIFAGEYSAPTPGTPGSAGESMEGLRKQINDDITATNITPINTGALDSDPATFVAQVETFVDDIPSKYRRLVKKVYMNEDEHIKFRRGMKAAYNMYYAQESDLDMIADRKIKVVGLPSMGTSDKLIASVESNIVVATKKPENQQGFSIESVDRLVKAFTDYYKGVGYWIPEWIFTNDRDLV